MAGTLSGRCDGRHRTPRPPARPSAPPRPPRRPRRLPERRDHRLPRRHQALRERRHRPRRRDVRDPPRRVRLPRRRHRLRQVDHDAAADQGARADRRRRSASPAATSSEITRQQVPYYRRNIGVVFQDFKLLPNRTVYDNVAYALQVTGGTRREIREKVPDILRLTGLSMKLHTYPDQLSGGEQQRVSVARAFVNHPPLLLADEPTGNLDPETSIGIMQLLYRINRTGTTVVVATHDLAHGRPHAPPRDRARRGPRRPRRARPAATRARGDHRSEFGAAPARRRRAMRLRLLPARGAARRSGATPSRPSPRWRRCSSPCSCSASSSRSCRRRPARPTRCASKVIVDVYLKTNADAAPTSSASAAADRATRRTSASVEFVSKEQAYARRARGATPRPTSCSAPTRCPTPSASRRTSPTTSARCATRSRRSRPAAGARSIDPAIDEVKNREDDTDKILSATRVVKLTIGAARRRCWSSPRCC